MRSSQCLHFDFLSFHCHLGFLDGVPIDRGPHKSRTIKNQCHWRSCKLLNPALFLIPGKHMQSRCWLSDLFNWHQKHENNQFRVTNDNLPILKWLRPSGDDSPYWPSFIQTNWVFHRPLANPCRAPPKLPPELRVSEPFQWPSKPKHAALPDPMEYHGVRGSCHHSIVAKTIVLNLNFGSYGDSGFEMRFGLTDCGSTHHGVCGHVKQTYLCQWWGHGNPWGSACANSMEEGHFHWPSYPQYGLVPLEMSSCPPIIRARPEVGKILGCCYILKTLIMFEKTLKNMYNYKI